MRHKYLDVAKGITILFVLMAHSCGFPFGLGAYCTAYFMALFFVVSGYNQKNADLNWSYIRRRGKKIIYPYFLYNSLIYLIYVIWKGFESIQDAALAVAGIFYSTYCLYYPIDTDNNLFFFRIENNATWFLTAFFCSNMVFLIYIKYCKKRSLKIFMFVLFILFSQMLYYCPIFLPWNADKAFIGASFMIIGYEMRQKGMMDMNGKWYTIFWTITFILLYTFLVNLNPGINLATREYGSFWGIGVWIYFIIGISGSVLCIWSSRSISKIPLVGKVLEILGKEALPIMAMHLILYRIIDYFLLSKFVVESGSMLYWGISAFRIISVCMVIIGVIYVTRYIRSRGKTFVG